MFCHSAMPTPTVLCINSFFGKFIQLIIGNNGFILHAKKHLQTITILQGNKTDNFE